MKYSISSRVEDILNENNIEAGKSVYIYSDIIKRNETLLESFKSTNFFDSKLHNDNELNKNFFFKNISLSNNLDFILNISNLSTNEYIRSTSFYDEYQKYKRYLVKDIPELEILKFMLEAYVFSTDTVIINYHPILIKYSISSEKFKLFFNKTIQDRQVIIFTDIKKPLEIKKYFNCFIVIYNCGYEIFSNFHEMQRHIKFKVNER